MEDILSKQRYLAGNKLTEADVRAFMTLIRFDEVRSGSCRPPVVQFLLSWGTPVYGAPTATQQSSRLCLPWTAKRQVWPLLPTLRSAQGIHIHLACLPPQHSQQSRHPALQACEPDPCHCAHMNQACSAWPAASALHVLHLLLAPWCCIAP